MRTSILLFLFSLFLVGTSWAQEEAAADSVDTITESTDSESVPSSDGEDAERIEVTGTLIKRIDIEGPNPVRTIEREEIEASGQNSVGGFLAQSASVSPFGGNGSNVSFKGLSSTRVLILVNGQRLAGDGSSYSNSARVDVNQLPLSAVERIEVLKDGASSRYGSDAQSGVINIITKKTLNGWSFTEKYDHTIVEGGDRNRTSLTYGQTKSNYSWLTSLQVESRESNRLYDDTYTRDLNKRYIFNDNYVDLDTPDEIHAGPDCDELVNVNGVDRCIETVSRTQGTNFNNKVSSYSQLNWDISDNLSYEGMLLYSEHRYAYQYFPMSEQFDFDVSEVPTSWATVLPNYNGTNGIRIWERFDQAGVWGNTNVVSTYGFINSISGFWGESMNWKISHNMQKFSSLQTVKNGVLIAEARDAIINGVYDPYGTARNTSTFVDDFEFHDEMKINWTEAVLSGELDSEIVGMAWSYGAGVSYSHQEYLDNPNEEAVDGNLAGRAATRGGGSRNSFGLMAEFSGIKDTTQELALALRYDSYNDFGDTINPKIGYKYRFNDKVALRTSWGTGFKAPSLQEAYGPTRQGFTGVIDELRCNDDAVDDEEACRLVRYPSTTGGNRDLNEETSESWNIGVVYEPADQFSITVDWWNVDVKDVITADVTKAVEAEAVIGRDEFEDKYPGVITRDPDTGVITSLNNQYQNQAAQKVRGIDISLNYDISTSFGQFYIRDEVGYMEFFKKTVFEELGEQNLLGDPGRPRWRNGLTIGYRKNKFNCSLTANTIAEHEKNDLSAADPIVDEYTEYDFQANYEFGFGNVQFGALNVLNSHPELDEGLGSKVDSWLYRTRRLLYVSYKADF